MPESPSTALLVGDAASLRRLERQLDLLPRRPVTLGWVLTHAERAPVEPSPPILGTIERLEAIAAAHRPDLAIVSLPAAMSDLVASLRTRLRRIGVADRFFPTLEDQLAGIGPRARFEIDLADLLQRRPQPADGPALRRIVAGQRVLITGAGGSIGGELARIVAQHEPALIALMDRSENALFEIDRQIARFHPAVQRRAILHDVVDAEGTLAVTRSVAPDLVLHAAAHKHVPMMEDHPGAAVDNNVFGTKSIADVADEIGAARFVMISTDKAVNPVSVMGATKRLAELYVQDLARRSGGAFSIVRFGNVLGSAGSVLDVWARQIAEGGPITVTDPRMTRYFMTIPEAAALVLQVAAIPPAGAGSASEGADVFLLDMGEPIRIVDLAQRFARLHGLEPSVGDGTGTGGGEERERAARGSGSISIVFTGARPGEKLREELVFEAEHLVPTEHPGIRRWKVDPPAPDFIKEMLCRLAPDVRDADPAAVADTVLRLTREATCLAAA
jgi:FlaA1/EpsC-like NDP-sugar epimerase